MERLGLIILIVLLVASIFLALPLLRMPVHDDKAVDDQGLQNLQEQESKIDINNIPQIVHHDFIELDKISKISKFRSGVGHDFSKGGDETDSCRSMKHYFELKGINDSFYHTNISKDAWPIVKYFAPVSGDIIDMRLSVNMFGDEEHQFLLRSDENQGVVFSFFHVLTEPGLKDGSKVSAGELLGTVSPGNSGEIAVSINSGSPDERLVSYFQVIDDEVFARYKLRGAGSREDFIISEQQRDLNPLVCDKDLPHRFIGSRKIPNDKKRYDLWSSGPDNWFFLK